jgi:hypothetical protein
LDKEEIRDIDEFKATYPDQWIALAIPEGGDQYEPKRGYLISHSPHREAVWAIVNAMPSDKGVYVFFNGPVMPRGFSVAFYIEKINLKLPQWAIEAAVIDLPPALGVEGLLGMSFLGRCRLFVDVPKQVVELSLSQPSP